MADYPAFSRTRYAGLGFSRQPLNAGRCLWRLVAYEDRPDWPPMVGPQYHTKAELLADLPDYAARSGWVEG